MILTDHLYRRYQVFISSTFRDLEKERNVVRNALVKHNYIVEGMEMFPATDKRQWEVIKERIDKSDLYVLIIADRFGSVAADAHAWEPELVGVNESISYTQLEFRYARHRRIPILAFIKARRKKPEMGARDQHKQEDKTVNDLRKEEERVSSFIAEVQTGRMTDYWKDLTELQSDIIASIDERVRSEGFTSSNGWVHAASLHHPIDYNNKAVFLASKLHYVKFVAHSEKGHGRPALYRKFVPRVGKEFDVWDEYNTVSVNCFSHCLNAYKFYTRTQGDALDFSVLMPYVEKLTFSDVKEGLQDKVLNPTIEAPSNVYAVATSYLNGFQRGNTELATKATHPARVLRMIVDFTSVPDHARRFRLSNCLEVDPSEREKDITREVRSLQPGVLLIERTNVPRDHVLKFNFELLA
ncbi:MAG: DUF4062 domain-containing protein [Flavobacteriales bacterium]|nr:DUF4062 domain-containing protein [Flavobacteriales bacterium]